MNTKVTRVTSAGGIAGNARSLANPFVSVQAADPLQEFTAFLTDRATVEASARNGADALRADEARAVFRRRATEELDGLDQLDPDFVRKAEDRLRGLSADVLGSSGVSGAQARDKLASGLDVLSQGFLATFGSQQRGTLEAEALRRTEVSTRELQANIAADPDGAEAFFAEHIARVEALRGALPPESIPALNEQTRSAAFLAMAEGLAEAGRFREAREVLERNRGDFTPEQFRAARGRVTSTEKNVLSQQRQARDRDIGDVRLALAELDPADPDALNKLEDLSKFIDLLDQQGALVDRDDTRVSLRQGVRAARQNVIDTQDRLNDLMERVEGRVQLDDQAEADEAFPLFLARERARAEAAGQPIPEDAIPAELVVDFIARTGFAPTTVARRIKSAETANDPRVLAEAVQLERAVRAVNPFRSTSPGKRVQEADAVASAFGADPVTAAGTVLDARTDATTMGRRRDQFERAAQGRKSDLGVNLTDQGLREFIARDLTNEQGLGALLLRQLPLSQTTGLAARSTLEEQDLLASIPGQSLTEFREAFQTVFELTGDEDAALRHAGQSFAARHGITRVNGKPRLQRFPPESVLPLDERADAQTRTDIVQAEMAMLTRERGIELDSGLQSRMFFSATPLTEAQIAAGEPPTYEVRVQLDPNIAGLTAPVLDATTGEPLTHTFLNDADALAARHPDIFSLDRLRQQRRSSPSRLRRDDPQGGVFGRRPQPGEDPDETLRRLQDR